MSTNAHIREENIHKGGKRPARNEAVPVIFSKGNRNFDPTCDLCDSTEWKSPVIGITPTDKTLLYQLASLSFSLTLSLSLSLILASSLNSFLQWHFWNDKFSVKRQIKRNQPDSRHNLQQYGTNMLPRDAQDGLRDVREVTQVQCIYNLSLSHFLVIYLNIAL